MRFRFLFAIIGVFVFLLSACGVQSNTLFTPAQDRLTFLFFYTDG